MIASLGVDRLYLLKGLKGPNHEMATAASATINASPPRIKPKQPRTRAPPPPPPGKERLMPALRTARVVVALVLLLTAGWTAAAQQPAWRPLAGELLKTENPGYGGLCGIVIDHKSAAIYLNLSDKGIYRSTD